MIVCTDSHIFRRGIMTPVWYRDDIFAQYAQQHCNLILLLGMIMHELIGLALSASP